MNFFLYLYKFSQYIKRDPGRDPDNIIPKLINIVKELKCHEIS